MNRLLAILFLVAGSMLTTTEVNAETILEEIQRTGVLRVGIRDDAIPFSYRKPNGDLTGYCVDFIGALKQRLSEQIEGEGLLIRLFQSTAANRFALVADRTVHIECGPNTITSNLTETGVSFSEPFFVTGTQFLILESQRDRINLNSSLADLRIGLLANTTTEQVVQERYPEATIIKLQGATARLRGVQGVLQGRFDSFISDGILLIGQVEALQPTDSYTLIPNPPLSCDQYGMILPDDSQWKSLINSIIQSEEEGRIWQDWFEVILPRIEETLTHCESD